MQRASERLRAAAAPSTQSGATDGGQCLTGSLRLAHSDSAVQGVSGCGSRRPSAGGDSVLSSRSSVLENHTNALGVSPAAGGGSGPSGPRQLGAKIALQAANALHKGQQDSGALTGATRIPVHERMRQRHIQRAQLLQAGDCEGLATMLLEDLAETVQRAPEVFSRLRRAIRAAPGYEVATVPTTALIIRAALVPAVSSSSTSLLQPWLACSASVPPFSGRSPSWLSHCCVLAAK